VIEQFSIDMYIEGATTPEAVRQKLTEAGLQFVDVSADFGYMNIRVPVHDGYFRIYQDWIGTIKTQRWRKTEMNYSGIPTFEPSGRKSF